MSSRLKVTVPTERCEPIQFSPHRGLVTRDKGAKVDHYRCRDRQFMERVKWAIVAKVRIEYLGKPKQTQTSAVVSGAAAATAQKSYTVFTKALLGQGFCASVYGGEDPDTKAKVVIKLNNPHDFFYQLARTERDVHLYLGSEVEYVAQLISHFNVTPTQKALVFPNYGESLFDLYIRDGAPGTLSMPFDDIKILCRHMTKALVGLAKKDVVHRDFKPENVLCDGKNYRLIDFGCANLTTVPYNPIAGSLHYKAPEMILCRRPDPSADIWSLGCIVLELYTGDLAFQSVPENEEGQSGLGAINDHMQLIADQLGKFPATWTQESAFFSKLFTVVGSGETLTYAPKDQVSKFYYREDIDKTPWKTRVANAG